MSRKHYREPRRVDRRGLSTANAHRISILKLMRGTADASAETGRLSVDNAMRERKVLQSAIKGWSFSRFSSALKLNIQCADASRARNAISHTVFTAHTYRAVEDVPIGTTNLGEDFIIARGATCSGTS